jgi:UDP-N-acetylmuramate--alanine ligase
MKLRVPGVHNLRVGRRFERLGEHGGVAVVDDYAHHPSELVATLSAARQAYPGRRLVAVFQPHLYSRTEAHGEAMGRALAAADLVIVTEVYAAREQPIVGVSGRRVADAATSAGTDATFEPVRAAVGRRVFDALRPGDVVLTLGAGDITRVGPELVRWLSAA